MLNSVLSEKGLAIVLVDMQAGFVGGLRTGSLKRIVPNQKRVLKLASNRRIPVAVLEFKGYGETLPELTELAKACPGYTAFEKYVDSGFSSGAFISWLENHAKAKSLFLMGINAGYCVKATAAGAIRRGYKIVIHPDMIAGMSHHRDDDHIGWYRKNGTVIS